MIKCRLFKEGRTAGTFTIGNPPSANVQPDDYARTGNALGFEETRGTSSRTIARCAIYFLRQRLIQSSSIAAFPGRLIRHLRSRPALRSYDLGGHSAVHAPDNNPRRSVSRSPRDTPALMYPAEFTGIIKLGLRPLGVEPGVSTALVAH